MPPPGKDTPHTWEHSLEVQLPMLQKSLHEFELIPVVFGETDYRAAATVLADFIDEQTILIASSDLSHYHPYDQAMRLDEHCVNAICKLDVNAMANQEACGKLPILTLMQLAIDHGWQTKLLDYRNSGDTAGDKTGVVGYAAIAFYEPNKTRQAPPVAQSLPREQQLYLLQLARTVLEQELNQQNIEQPEPTALAPAIIEEKGCFVTLTIDGRLRGCIGHIFPQEPLYLAVMHNASSAALRDWRFNPVRPDELEHIEIEISVLTVPKKLSYDSPEHLLAKLRAGIDGVVFECRGRKSTYLPQVWDQLPEKKLFLDHLAQKAGLHANAWRDNDAVIQTYQVQAFSESEF